MKGKVPTIQQLYVSTRAETEASEAPRAQHSRRHSSSGAAPALA